MGEKKKIKVLFVCLGNICRSPMAEAIFLKKLADHGLTDRFEVESAGISHHHRGEKYHKETIAVCERKDVPITGTSRPVQSRDFSHFDYLIAMDSSNYQDLLDLCDHEPMLKKISHMLDYSQEDHVPGLDVPDPYYGGREGFERVFELLNDACNGLLMKIAEDHKLRLGTERDERP